MSGPQVFFSYASENREVVDSYVAEFERLGIDVWIDHMKIDHGHSIVGWLNRAIDECQLAIVFFSAAYARKPWTNEEQKALLYTFVESNREGAENRAIFVVRLDDSPLPPLLRHRLWSEGHNASKLACSVAQWIGLEPKSISTAERRVISEIPNQLDGVNLEQLAVQLVQSIQSISESKVPICLTVFIKRYGQIVVQCMPRPACDGVVEDISACLYRCNAHRRHIGAHQKKLASGGLGVFDEAFRIALDEQIAMLDKTRFGDSREPGLRQLLDALILQVLES